MTQPFDFTGRIRGCSRKTRYPQKARKRSGGEVWEYRCPVGCGGWHIGHPPGLRAKHEEAS